MTIDKKTIYKTITYRIICILTLMLVTFLFTQDLIKVSGIVIVFQTIQTIIYWLHEKIYKKYWKEEDKKKEC